MLTREEVIQLAKAYETLEGARKVLEWREKKRIEEEEDYQDRLQDRLNSINEAKLDIFKAEKTVFELEKKNGNFG